VEFLKEPFPSLLVICAVLVCYLLAAAVSLVAIFAPLHRKQISQILRRSPLEWTTHLFGPSHTLGAIP
jgi:hypothetical protein